MTWPRRRVLLAVALGLAIAGAAWGWMAAPAPAPAAGMAAPAAWAQAAAGHLLLIDIRTPAEWRRTGLPQHAVTADWNRLGPRAFIARVETLTAGDHTTPIAVICARGNRSSQAARHLRTAGFTAVWDIREGMLGNRLGAGWLARGLPTVRYEERADGTGATVGLLYNLPASD